MDFSLTDAQRDLCARVTHFARTELGDRAAEHDRAGTLDRAGWRKCADFGLLGWPAPVRHGGADLDPLTAALAYEAFGYACRDNGLVFAVNNHVWACMSYLVEHGTESQRARYLPSMCDGSLLGAHAVTEPGSGSDVLSITTTARRDGDGYVLDGEKTFISNGTEADLFVVFARTGADEPAQDALSAFLVERSNPGLVVSRAIGKIGLRGCPMGELVLSGCRVGADALLGREGAGYRLFTLGMDWERGLMFATQVGVLRRLFETCVAYAGERRQFGRPIGTFQSVAHRIADMRMRLELAQLLLYKVGWLKRERRLAVLETSLLKLFVSESLVGSALDAVQLHGARGVVNDLDIERELRDTIATTVYGGTSEIQRNIISSLVGLPVP
ncbi:acyl-CoA dehydrogenase family protein [Plantactinospora sp. DSM 117369]